jgi:hypothetical protein
MMPSPGASGSTPNRTSRRYGATCHPGRPPKCGLELDCADRADHPGADRGGREHVGTARAVVSGHGSVTVSAAA